MAQMTPTFPTYPKWPEVNWVLIDDYYALSDEDADQILDFAENKLEQFYWELEVYKEQIEVLLASLNQ